MIGQYPWMGESKWGCIFPCNLDPSIPQGKGWFNTRVYIDYNLRDYQPPGPHMDGIGLDSFGGYGQDSRANYRREHFRYAHFPLSFSAADRVPVQVVAFASVEWLRELAAEMHGRGLVLMTNCSWGSTPAWLTFAAPYLDIFGAEATQFADPDFIRAIAYRKPCTDLPYNPRPDWEVEWHLLHDIYPGHGNTVEVMGRYAGLLRDLSAAGWEPVTFARVEPAQLRIERYGSGDRVCLVVHNPGTDDVQASIRLDLAALGLKQARASKLPSGEAVPVEGQTIGIAINGRATAVVLIEPR
jgi:hypothetical protein